MSEKEVNTLPNGSVKGEKILCQFRKIVGPFVIAGTGRHRSQRATIWGLPAICTVEKDWDF